MLTILFICIIIQAIAIGYLTHSINKLRIRSDLDRVAINYNTDDNQHLLERVNDLDKDVLALAVNADKATKGSKDLAISTVINSAVLAGLCITIRRLMKD